MLRCCFIDFIYNLSLISCDMGNYYHYLLSLSKFCNKETDSETGSCRTFRKRVATKNNIMHHTFISFGFP